jgi:hypothetical protein
VWANPNPGSSYFRLFSHHFIAEPQKYLANTLHTCNLTRLQTEFSRNTYVISMVNHLLKQRLCMKANYSS